MFWLFGAVLLAVVLFFITREARNDREWVSELAETTRTVEQEGVVTLYNVRDFIYQEEVREQWIDEVVLDPNAISRVWFVLEPLNELNVVGHTFLTFEFTDGSAYSFSVEARKERGEKYSAFSGLFRAYELAYTWGTERDFVSRRVLQLDHAVYMYPLTLTQNESEILFTELAERTEEIALRPRFYNTLTANCTNVLARIVNDLESGRVPYDISWNLPGYSDRFLARIGLIEESGGVEEMRKNHAVSHYKEEVRTMASIPANEFSVQLRALLMH